MGNQSKFASFIEACTNTAVGFIFSYLIQQVLIHAYNVQMSNETAAYFVGWFTIASVLRSYIIRRLWNNGFWMVWQARWKYRNIDPDVCCCGSQIGEGGSICGHGGCRSSKEYAINHGTHSRT